MLNFVCILAIFLEIILTVIFAIKINQLDKEVIICNKKLELSGIKIIKISKNIRKTVINLNKTVKFITNKKLIKTFQILRMTIDIVQTIVLLKSLNLSNGLKSINYKNIRKIMVAELARRFIRRFIFKYLQTT